ncbi:replication-associated recombination protein A [Polyangium mundeleinium]|uniref:Replication-associated recombination protein A n=1 Tax=Polyangium mundeleinium TaxID=2995306 RepID=A0ABT5F6J5_9BACT|nr:replication-associated recombination protein A [Polyangium mundeleinium]MDC0749732.1 replication-associated recombination protein A [Polyangium mundeleinium]
MTARRSPRGGEKDAGPTLFEAALKRDPKLAELVPLAERMRPRALSDLVGQEHLVGEGKLLAHAIAADRVPSMILWGPPGSGKTTLARIVAESTRARFVPFNAVLGGVPELRVVMAAAKEARAYEGKRTILFVDEIHRFNRAQQDAFLPHVEDGTITLIGATTENPSFAVNAPLLSRCRVFRLNLLDEKGITELLRRAIESQEGLAGSVGADEEAIEAIAKLAAGDARRALTTLEIASDEAKREGRARVTREDVVQTSGQKTLLYDKAGEEHYNVISAFIKSMRGSDPDAAIYWLMRMLEAGDDPLFLLRRMMIFASEDVGNADPRALDVAVAADAAFQRVGMPEGTYFLAQAALYLACAPKSNACNAAWHAAQEVVRERGSLPVPMKLRNAVTGLMKREGYGTGYRYAHDEKGGIAWGETYLPDAIAGTHFYEPTERGYEKVIAERVRWIRAQQSPPLSREGGLGAQLGSSERSPQASKEGSGVRASSEGEEETEPNAQSSSADKAD